MDNFEFSTNPFVSYNDSQLGYDGVKDRQRRRPPKKNVYLQDAKLLGPNRQSAIATSQDLVQNFPVVGWAVRKHLDYVSSFNFQANSGNAEVDRVVEEWLTEWSKKRNCDVAGRHNLSRFVRLMEMRRIVDGDVFVARIGGTGPKRGTLQAIEGYRVSQPNQDVPTSNPEEILNWVNGVRVNKYGEAQRYCVYTKTMQGNNEFTGFMSARNVTSLGYYERFDQVRGISPILSALNSFQDVYEAQDLALAKMKISQIFGLVMTRTAVEAEDQYGGPYATEDTDGDGINDAGYDFDFGAGPQLMDLDEGHDAKFIESATPATQAVDYMKFCLRLALKALDLPDSFLAEDVTNYFGSRGALNHYLRSCQNKIADLTEALDEITQWRLGMAFAAGELDLPAGVKFEDLSWRWVHRGLPWWNPEQEANGNIAAIQAGFDNYENVTLQNGTWIEDNIRINGKWEKMALELTGRPLAPAIGAPGASSLGDEEPTEDPETEEDTEERTEEEKDNTNDE
tara:strand:- start:309 stop:1838 length:1530 start_codon:yes stop_codon:yes gene_type:complete